jgi:hypothetical protein
MNLQTLNRSSGDGISLLIVSVIFAMLAVAIKLFVSVPALDANRAAVLAKALAEIRATENASLNNAGWIDQSRGIVRLPIETAVQLAAQAWQHPASARADLNARAEKAAAPAPKAPEKPSAFE